MDVFTSVFPRREPELAPALPNLLFDEHNNIILRQSFHHYKVLPQINKHATPVPKLPLPPLAQTLQEYLSAIEAVVNDEQFQGARDAVHVFGAPGGIGEDLQAQLKQIDEETENWAYDWWLDDMYLKNRIPLPINSNPGMVFPKQHFKNQDDQVRFAVKLVLGIVEYKRSLDNKTIPVDMSGGKDPFPFCMAQHYRLLTSYRRPEAPKDILVSTSPFHDGYHIIVACKGQFYELKVTQEEETIPREMLVRELKRVLKIVNEEPPELPVGVLTSDHRDNWANARRILAKETVNENSLNSIERSLCVICFEDPLPLSFNYEGNSKNVTRDDSNVTHQMLYGGGSKFNSYNRWFDKSMQLVITSDGFCGLCYEHSAAEGIVVIQLLEKLIRLPNDNETSTKHTTAQWPVAKKLRWKAQSSELQNAILSATQNINKMGEDLDFYVLRFNDYGREYPKKNKISPDVFVQLALQLAYYKVHRQLVSTYESAGTRRFHLGRVDNIRAATIEALHWVKAMENNTANQDKLQLFRKAIARQTQLMTSNITGQGIDCHLLALRELAAERGMSTPKLFSNECYSIFNDFRLSTSQVSTQTESFMGYGAVVPDGYGASYNLRPDGILFCIASFRNCSETNSALFATAVETSLLQIKDLLDSTQCN